MAGGKPDWQIVISNPTPAIAAAVASLLSARMTKGYLGLFTMEGKQVSNASVSVDSAGLVATVSFTDDKGNAASPAAPPVWSSSDTGIAVATPAADGMTAQISLPGKDGNVTIAVTAEGDPTPGADTVSLSADITVTAGEIKSGAITFNPATPPPVSSH